MWRVEEFGTESQFSRPFCIPPGDARMQQSKITLFLVLSGRSKHSHLQSCILCDKVVSLLSCNTNTRAGGIRIHHGEWLSSGSTTKATRDWFSDDKDTVPGNKQKKIFPNSFFFGQNTNLFQGTPKVDSWLWSQHKVTGASGQTKLDWLPKAELAQNQGSTRKQSKHW